jgi:hypothetical protein
MNALFDDVAREVLRAEVPACALEETSSLRIVLADIESVGRGAATVVLDSLDGIDEVGAHEFVAHVAQFTGKIWIPEHRVPLEVP